MDTTKYKRIGETNFTQIKRAVVYMEFPQLQNPLTLRFHGEFADNHRENPETLKLYFNKKDRQLFNIDFLEKPSEKNGNQLIYAVHKEEIWVDKNEDHITYS